MATRPRLLFVDDEPHVLAGLRRALRGKSSAWDMTFEGDPTAALALYRQERFDVVVSDLSMPGLNGFSLIGQMRALDYESRFIMLTGTADLSAAVKAINEAEVFRFFTKPCAANLLQEGIQAALEDLTASVSGQEPHLQEISAAIGLAALNRLALGVLVTDADGRLILANRAGGLMLSERDGISLSANEIVRAAIPKQSEALLALIRDACADAERDQIAGLSLERPSSKRPLIALVTSLNIDNGTAGIRAVIFVADTEKRALPSEDSIGRLFGLSRAESKLVRCLAEGERIEQAAEICGVTTSTARTYLKQIFQKTGTDRQVDLVRLVLTTPELS